MLTRGFRSKTELEIRNDVPSMLSLRRSTITLSANFDNELSKLFWDFLTSLRIKIILPFFHILRYQRKIRTPCKSVAASWALYWLLLLIFGGWVTSKTCKLPHQLMVWFRKEANFAADDSTDCSQPMSPMPEDYTTRLQSRRSLNLHIRPEQKSLIFVDHSYQKSCVLSFIQGPCCAQLLWCLLL